MNELFELLEGEKVVATYRKHWLVFLQDAFTTILVGILVPVVILMVAALTIASRGNSLGILPTFFLALWELVIWTALFVIWTDYYLDVWMITNHRIVNINQIGLFHRETTSWQVDRVQQVTIGVKNIFETFFDYGSLEVQTAGPTDTFAMIEGVSHPKKIQESIMAECARFTNNQNQATVKIADQPALN